MLQVTIMRRTNGIYVEPSLSLSKLSLSKMPVVLNLTAIKGVYVSRSVVDSMTWDSKICGAQGSRRFQCDDFVYICNSTHN